MKMYAIRDKETGKWLLDVGEWCWYASLEEARIWANIRTAEKELRDVKAEAGKLEDRFELVTLRIEPTEPCEYCADWVPAKLQPYGHIEPLYCDMCGRRLTDDETI